MSKINNRTLTTNQMPYMLDIMLQVMECTLTDTVHISLSTRLLMVYSYNMLKFAGAPLRPKTPKFVPRKQLTLQFKLQKFTTLLQGVVVVLLEVSLDFAAAAVLESPFIS